MTTLKQQFAIDGQAISNNHEDMVITLDAHPSVQIKTIQDDSITYEFLGDVAQDSTYKLNLTFVYKKLHKLVLPLTLKHTLNDPLISTTYPTKSVKVWDEGKLSDINFKVYYMGTDPRTDITEKMTNVVITGNEFVTIENNTDWRVIKGNTTQSFNTELGITFDVEHEGKFFHGKGILTFNIAQYNPATDDFTTAIIGKPEGTLGVESEIYVKVLYQGRYWKGARVSPTTGSMINVNIVKQADDDVNERLVLTIKPQSVGTALQSRYFIYKGGTASGVYSTLWTYTDVWAKAITASRMPSRFDTIVNTIYKSKYTDVRIGHEKVTMDDPRLEITQTNGVFYPIMGYDKDGIWYLNNYGTVGTKTSVDVTIGYKGDATWTPRILTTDHYTLAGVGEQNELTIVNPTTLEPSKHNTLEYNLVNKADSGSVSGLVLQGVPIVRHDSGTPLIKYYNDMKIEDTPTVGRVSLSLDVAHGGGNVITTAIFKDATDKLWVQKVWGFWVDRAPFKVEMITEQPIKITNTDKQTINFKTLQDRFNAPNTVVSGTAEITSTTGAVASATAPTAQADNTWLTDVTPTGEGGTGTLVGTVLNGGFKYPITVPVEFDRVTAIEFVDTPLSVNVFDIGTDVPFQVLVEGVDVTVGAKITFTPTANIIANGETGRGWEIWTAPKAGVTEKITYQVEVTGVSGKPEVYEHVGTFNIAAWDGKMLKMEITDNYIGITNVQDTTVEFTTMYRGKPGADKVEVMELGSLGWYIDVVSALPSEDKSKFILTVRGRVAAAHKQNVWNDFLTIQNIRFGVIGTPQTTLDVDWVDKGAYSAAFCDDYLTMYGAVHSIQGAQYEVSHMRSGAVQGSSVGHTHAFISGKRVLLKDIYCWVDAGTHAKAIEYVYGEDDRLYAQITRAYSGSGMQNLLRCKWVGSENGKYTFTPTGSEAYLYVFTDLAGSIGQTALTTQTTAVASDDNVVTFGMQQPPLVLDQTNRTLKGLKLVPYPAGSNAVIPDSDWSIEPDTDPTKWKVKFAAGHTGKGFRIDGATESATTGRKSRLNVLMVVPQAQSKMVFLDPDIPAKIGQPFDAEFTLELLQYKLTPIDLSGITFKSVSLTGNAAPAGVPVHVEGNKFKMPCMGTPTFGTVSLTGTFTEAGAPDIEYGFAGTFITVDDSTLHVVGKTLNVTVFQEGTEIPFTVRDGESTEDLPITDVKITANEYVHTSGGANWEIWTAPKEGIVTIVRYEVTVTTSTGPEIVVYNASFNIAPWDGKMLKIDYNYAGPEKKHAYARFPVSMTTDIYEVYPIYRGKPAADKVMLRSIKPSIPGVGIRMDGYTADGLGLRVVLWTSTQVSQPVGADDAYIQYCLTDANLNGQANNIPDVTMVQHDLKVRAYKPDVLNLWVINPSDSKLPLVYVNSAFRVYAELGMGNSGELIPLDDDKVSIVYNSGSKLSGLGVDANHIYHRVNLGLTAGTTWHPISALYDNKLSTAAQVRTYAVTGPAKTDYYLINMLPGQNLLPNSVQDVKVQVVRNDGSETALTNVKIASLKGMKIPETGTALVRDPKASEATMGGDGTWTVKVNTGWTGTQFRLIGAIHKDGDAEDYFELGDVGGLTVAGVAKAKGIGKCITETFEVKGQTKTHFYFNLKLPKFDGDFDVTAGSFKTFSLTGAGKSTAALPTWDTTKKAWYFANVEMVEDGGMMKMSGTFTVTGDTTVYELAEFETQIVSTSKIVFTDVPKTINIFDAGRDMPFTATDGTNTLELLNTATFSSETMESYSGNYWRPIVSAIPLEGKEATIEFEVTATIDGVLETHRHVGKFNVNPWDGVEFRAKTWPTAALEGPVGKSIPIAPSFEFRGVSKTWNNTEWKTDPAALLLNSDGVAELISEGNYPGTNNPFINIKGLKPSKSEFLYPVKYVGAGSTEWPENTPDKNLANITTSVHIWDLLLHFDNDVQPGPIVATKGDTITIPAVLTWGKGTPVAISSATITQTSPVGFLTLGAKGNADFKAVVNGTNNTAEDIDVPVRINYTYTANADTYTLSYDQIITLKGTPEVEDVIEFLYLTDIITRNWQKGQLPFGIKVNSMDVVIKDVKVTANEYIASIPKDSNNMVWQCIKGGVDGEVKTTVEFVVTVSDGIRDHVVKKTIDVTIAEDDGSVFWVEPVYGQTAYDMVGSDVRRAVALRGSGAAYIYLGVTGYLKGDAVETTAVTDHTLDSNWTVGSLAKQNTYEWRQVYNARTSAYTPRVGIGGIRLKYGTATAVEGQNTGTFRIPLYAYDTAVPSATSVVVTNPTEFVGKFGDTFEHYFNVGYRGSPLDLNSTGTEKMYDGTSASNKLATLTVKDSRHFVHAFAEDVEDEVTFQCWVMARPTGTSGAHGQTLLKFTQKPLIPKLAVTTSETTPIVGTKDDTGEMALVVKYGEDIIPIDDPKLAITANKGLEATKGGAGFNWKIVLGNTNAAGTYSSDVTVSYEYHPGRFATKVFAQSIQFTPTNREVTVVDVPLRASVWDIGVGIPFTLWAAGDEVTSLMTDINVVQNVYIKKKADAIWQVTSNTAIEETLVETEFTYRLNDELLVRTAKGTFIINKYDGKEFTPYIEKTGTQWVEGMLLIGNNLSSGGSNPQYNVKIVGVYRGEPVVMSKGDGPVTTPLVDVIRPTTSNLSLTYVFKSNVVGVFGSASAVIDVKRYGTATAVEGIDVANLPIEYVVYDLTADQKYLIAKLTPSLTGVIGDEMEVQCLAFNKATVIDLTDPAVTITLPGGRLELVEGSVTRTGFKVKFASGVDNEVVGDQNVVIGNTTYPTLTATGKIALTQQAGWIALERVDGFVDAADGSMDNPLLLKQQVKTQQ